MWIILLNSVMWISWQCPLLNISYCPPSEAVSSGGKSLVWILVELILFTFSCVKLVLQIRLSFCSLFSIVGRCNLQSSRMEERGSSANSGECFLIAVMALSNVFLGSSRM